MSDRTYVRLPGHAWHGFTTWTRTPGTVLTMCGRTLHADDIEEADRLPPDGHACGNCTRRLLAQTDVEEDPFAGTVAPV